MHTLGAKVLAVDANPINARLARVNAPHADIVEVALSDYHGAAPFQMPSAYDDGWGSLIAADKPNGSIMVPVWRLDEMVKDVNRIQFIKMDIEGAELSALRGLGAYLPLTDYFLIECQDIPERAAITGAQVPGISQLLVGDHGFRVYGYDDTQRIWRKLQSAYSCPGRNFLFASPNMPNVEVLL